MPPVVPKSVDNGNVPRSNTLRRQQLLLTLLGYLLCVSLFRGVIGYREVLYGHGPQVMISGLHIHHFIFGLALLLVTLMVYRATNGGKPRLCSLMTGIGLAMVLDETSLWFPVGPEGYWAVQNLFVTVIVGVFLLFRAISAGGRAPVDVPPDEDAGTT